MRRAVVTMLPILLIVLLAGPATLRAQAVALHEGVRIEIGTPIVSVTGEGGYGSCRFIFENEGDRERRFTIEGYTHFMRRMTIFRDEVRIPPRARIVRDVPVPAFWPYAPMIEVLDESDDEVASSSIAIWARTGRRGTVPPSPGAVRLDQLGVLLVSDHGVNEQTLVDAVGHVGGFASLERIAPADVPTRWQGLSGIDVVVIGEAELLGLEPEARSSIANYLNCGGVLVLTGSSESGASRLLRHARLEPGTEPLVGRAFFGRLVVTPYDPFAVDGAWTDVLAALLRDSVVDPRSEYHPVRAEHRLGGVFEREWHEKVLPDLDEVSPSILVFVLILYALLVGPLSLYWLMRTGRRPLILLTVPVLSAVFLLGIVGYGLAVEGFRTQAASRSLTLIDAATRTAVRKGVDALHGGAVLRPELSFSSDTLAVPFPRTFDVRLGVDWSEGVELIGEWVQPRVTSEILRIAPRTCRARLSLREQGGVPAVENGLGVGVRGLLAVLPDGRRVAVHDLAAGATGRTDEASEVGVAEFVRSVIGVDDPLVALLLTGHDTLGPGEWFAVLEDELETPPGQEGIARRSGAVLAKGTLE